MGLRNSKGINRVPEALSLRSGCERDLTYVRDIDLKSSHYPWPNDRWGVLESGVAKLSVAVMRGEPVGFAVFVPVEGDVDILRLGVKPDYRRQGIGTRLLDYIKDHAVEQRFLRLTMTIAEILCVPGHPDDVSVWLSTYGFLTEAPLIKEYAYMYGQWVDGYRFAYTLGGGNGPTV